MDASFLIGLQGLLSYVGGILLAVAAGLASASLFGERVKNWIACLETVMRRHWLLRKAPPEPMEIGRPALDLWSTGIGPIGPAIDRLAIPDPMSCPGIGEFSEDTLKKLTESAPPAFPLKVDLTRVLREFLWLLPTALFLLILHHWFGPWGTQWFYALVALFSGLFLSRALVGLVAGRCPILSFIDEHGASIPWWERAYVRLLVGMRFVIILGCLLTIVEFTLAANGSCMASAGVFGILVLAAITLWVADDLSRRSIRSTEAMLRSLSPQRPIVLIGVFATPRARAVVLRESGPAVELLGYSGSLAYSQALAELWTGILVGVGGLYSGMVFLSASLYRILLSPLRSLFDLKEWLRSVNLFELVAALTGIIGAALYLTGSIM
jgi:hypothetical protein